MGKSPHPDAVKRVNVYVVFRDCPEYYTEKFSFCSKTPRRDLALLKKIRFKLRKDQRLILEIAGVVRLRKKEKPTGFRIEETVDLGVGSGNKILRRK